MNSPTITSSHETSLGRAAATRAARPTLSAQRSFAAVLGKRLDQPIGGEQLSPERVAREAAEAWVATAFVQPVLKQLRASNNAAPPFAPGPGEKQFRSLMDTELSQRLTHASNFPIVDRIASDLLKNVQSRAAAALAPRDGLDRPASTETTNAARFSPAADR